MNAYIEDTWLAAQIDRPAYRLAPSVRINDESLSSPPDGPFFAFGKIASSDVAAANALLSHGFQYVNTQVVLTKSKTAVTTPAKGIREAIPEDRQRVWDIAYNAYSYDRFHIDSRLAPYADGLNASWATNYFNGNRGTDMLLWEEDGTVAGFILLIVKDGVFDIDLIAVDAPFKRRGIANHLMQAAEYKYSECNSFEVITQLENTPAINMYYAHGYAVSNLDMVFHEHRL